ncbi:MAG: DUF2339 domain-containing protein [Opitutaceae bacterium]|jgi:hypothetical protein
MEGLLILLILFLVLVLIVLPIWTLVSIASAKEANRRLASQLEDLKWEFEDLRRANRNAGPSASRPAEPTDKVAEPFVKPEVAPEWPQPAPTPDIVVPSEPAPMPSTMQEAAVPPPAQVFGVVPPPLPDVAEETAVARSDHESAAEEKLPPSAPEPVVPREPLINWELFMGVKLFAWIGGFALFLAVAFFVKYSFEHDLIPPEVRVAIGYLVSVGLVVGGVRLARSRYAVTAQTLCAAGVVSLYAVTFACHAVYKFPFFGPLPTFGLMVLITGVAFLLAVRMEAKVVAVLGMLGGFVTPVLLGKAVDNPLALFGYVALLDLGLVAVAMHRRWHFLVPLGAGGTLVMLLRWTGEFFAADKVFIAMGVCLGFGALFIATLALLRRLGRTAAPVAYTALAAPFVSFGYAFYFLDFPSLGERPGLLFLFVLFAELLLLAVVLIEEALVKAQMVAGALVFVFLGCWTTGHLTEPLLPWALGGFFGFTVLFAGVFALVRLLGRDAESFALTAVAAPFVMLGFAFYFLRFAAFAAHPAVMFALILAAELLLLTVVLRELKFAKAQLFLGMAAFALLAVWVGKHLTIPLMPWALGGFLGFAVLHTVLPLVMRRLRPEFASPSWAQLAAPVTLLLVLGAVCKFETVSWLVWPCVLLLDLIAIVLAFFTASLVSVAAVLVLTLLAMGAWIFRIPMDITAPFALLGMLAGFALLFFGAGLFLVRRFGPKLTEKAAGSPFLAGLPGDPRAHLPAMSALLPFTLLVMVILRLPLANPAPVFGLALLLVALTLGLAKILVLEWLPAAALAGVLAVQGAWLATRFHAGDGAGMVIAWNVGFYAVFALFPFVFRKTLSGVRGPWVVAALGAPMHFWFVYRAVQLAFPNDFMGLLPAAFAVPALASLVIVLRSLPAEHPQRLERLAWFGGVALLFITLIIPIQFSREWRTLGWALEGAALLWLFQRVPHAGLRAVGVALLAAVFARLALNPAVLDYHPRAATPIFNWYFYTYGLAAVCFLTGARLLETPREKVFGFDMPPVLRAGAVILAFLLLNIEIADYFSTTGSALMFQFSGNLARDMTYTIAWALFAFGLLVIGVWKTNPMARYASMALLVVALLKLFFHDLAHLEQIYRIVALAVVAVIAILASFVYQRFLSPHEKAPPSAR